MGPFMEPASSKNHAAELTHERTRSARANPSRQNRLVWLSLGAMTNVAAALRLAVEASEKTGARDGLPDEILILGTRLDGAWDFNVWSDPSAAAYLFLEAPKYVNVTVIPTDSVDDAVLGMRELDRLRQT